MTDQIICIRCGKCCDMGTIWVNSEHPLIKRVAAYLKTDDFDDGGLCDMLMLEKGKAVCWIQKYLGYEAKPDVCREYPEAGEKCRKDDSNRLFPTFLFYLYFCIDICVWICYGLFLRSRNNG